MGFTREEVVEDLSVPHESHCDYYDVYQEENAASVPGKRTLVKKCHSCQGQDHLMYEVGPQQDEQASTSFDMEDEFKVNEDLREVYHNSEGMKMVLTSIAQHPSQYIDKIQVGVMCYNEGDKYRRTSLIDLPTFESWVDAEKITPE